MWLNYSEKLNSCLIYDKVKVYITTPFKKTESPQYAYKIVLLDIYVNFQIYHKSVND